MQTPLYLFFIFTHTKLLLVNIFCTFLAQLARHCSSHSVTHRYGFKCEVWEDMTNGGHNDEPEQHYSAAVAVQSDPAEPKVCCGSAFQGLLCLTPLPQSAHSHLFISFPQKTAAWTNKGLQAFQDQLMGQGPTHHQKAAAAAAAAAAAPEEPPVRASESTLIYFQENAEDGEAKNVNFVDSENFNSVWCF